MRSELGPHARRLIGRIELLSRGVLADDVRSALKDEVASHLLASTQAREELHASPKEADRAAAKAFGRVWPMIHGMYRDEVAAKAPSKRAQTICAVVAGLCSLPYVLLSFNATLLPFALTSLGLLVMAVLGFRLRHMPLAVVRDAVLTSAVAATLFAFVGTAISPGPEVLIPRDMSESALRGVPHRRADLEAREVRVQTFHETFLANPVAGRVPVYEWKAGGASESWRAFPTLESTRIAWQRAVPDAEKFFAEKQRRLNKSEERLRAGLAASPLEKIRLLPEFLMIPVLVAAFVAAYGMLVGFAYAMAMSSLRHRLRRRRVNFRA
jgi:hypothetical protein